MTLKVLVTRPERQADNLCFLVDQIGGTAIRFPVLEIVPIEPDAKIKATLSSLNKYHWLFFVSTNAVNFALRANNGKIETLPKVRIVAVGQATAEALREVGIKVYLVPEQGFNSEAVLAMPPLQQLTGQSCLLVRGQGGRELLAHTLEERGAQVDYLEVYRRILPKVDSRPVEKLLSRNELDVIVITSGEALSNLVELLDGVRQQLFSTPMVVLSQRIKHLATELGFKQVAVSEKPSDTALVKAIVNGEKRGRSE